MHGDQRGSASVNDKKMPDAFGASGKPLSEEKCDGLNHRTPYIAFAVPTTTSK